jgi:hypothetical protein
VAKPEGKRPLEIPRRMWENNIKINLREIQWVVVVVLSGFIWLWTVSGGWLL